jgi:hypothetical protein
MLDQPALYALLAFGGWPRKKKKAAEEQRIWNNSCLGVMAWHEPSRSPHPTTYRGG